VALKEQGKQLCLGSRQSLLPRQLLEVSRDGSGKKESLCQPEINKIVTLSSSAGSGGLF